MTSNVKVEAAHDWLDRCTAHNLARFESALAAVESEGDGWIEIKDGCEMPPDSPAPIEYLITFTHRTRARVSLVGSAFWYSSKKHWEDGLGRALDNITVTHYQPLPAPPTKEGR